ncbi:uncharacterized protein LOC125799435 isoform X2 [Astyanax mexicanus]|uniref:uncharacterized protein LOC125799435 isoform X2 n=1 Tax=Astyanax mexicanus TaxID=7994 RepID=UPI0020CB0DD8|nr:uncharacterized protein LOC125799435 isoform X2 [Astyanax mexicanus]
MADGDGTGAEFLYKWTKVSTEAFIKARAEEEALFTGEKNSAMSGWRTVLQKIGLEGKVAPQQARKKWDNLKKKYKVAVHLQHPGICCGEWRRRQPLLAQKRGGLLGPSGKWNATESS